MKKYIFYLLGLCLFLSGCTVRTYQMTKDRVDQNLTEGNRGYIMGDAPALEEKERKSTRTTQVVEIELGRQIKIEPKAGKGGKATEGQAVGQPVMSESSEEMALTPSYEQYKVQKGDTLQKISKKFYGTTKHWKKIYEANTDVLKSPERVYPGQVLNIPDSAELKAAPECREKLK